MFITSSDTAITTSIISLVNMFSGGFVTRFIISAVISGNTQVGLSFII